MDRSIFEPHRTVQVVARDSQANADTLQHREQTHPKASFLANMDVREALNQTRRCFVGAGQREMLEPEG